MSVDELQSDGATAVALNYDATRAYVTSNLRDGSLLIYDVSEPMAPEMRSVLHLTRSSLFDARAIAFAFLGSPSAVATVAVAGDQGVGLFTVGDDEAVLFRSSAEYTDLTGVALSQTEPGLVLTTTRDEGELFLFDAGSDLGSTADLSFVSSHQLQPYGGEGGKRPKIPYAVAFDGDYAYVVATPS